MLILALIHGIGLCIYHAYLVTSNPSALHLNVCHLDRTIFIRTLIDLANLEQRRLFLLQFRLGANIMFVSVKLTTAARLIKLGKFRVAQP